ncbi:hydrogenase/urease nickel incorporation protein HypA [Vibrio taketomensis]|uniref:hydrogenase/urease nickel incorporation protein HypA n=1 Tax=Vibrio taketomensis TaxID=2572923 RepID=UPI001389F6B1|nr:hydrogenase/urease nickel incorporation protein HypA [Vibrio taketomensis]
MHEYSIVSALIEQCENHARDNNANRVTRVAIKVGQLSGVEPALLETAFDTFKQEGVCRDALLEIQIQPLVIHCHECQRESVMSTRQVLCPLCNSRNTQVIDGEELLLMQLELET